MQKDHRNSWNAIDKHMSSKITFRKLETHEISAKSLFTFKVISVTDVIAIRWYIIRIPRHRPFHLSNTLICIAMLTCKADTSCASWVAWMQKSLHPFDAWRQSRRAKRKLRSTASGWAARWMRRKRRGAHHQGNSFGDWESCYSKRMHIRLYSQRSQEVLVPVNSLSGSIMPSVRFVCGTLL